MCVNVSWPHRAAAHPHPHPHYHKRLRFSFSGVSEVMEEKQKNNINKTLSRVEKFYIHYFPSYHTV